MKRKFDRVLGHELEREMQVHDGAEVLAAAAAQQGGVVEALRFDESRAQPSRPST